MPSSSDPKTDNASRAAAAGAKPSSLKSRIKALPQNLLVLLVLLLCSLGITIFVVRDLLTMPLTADYKAQTDGTLARTEQGPTPGHDASPAASDAESSSQPPSTPLVATLVTPEAVRRLCIELLVLLVLSQIQIAGLLATIRGLRAAVRQPAAKPEPVTPVKGGGGSQAPVLAATYGLNDLPRLPDPRGIQATTQAIEAFSRRVKGLIEEARRDRQEAQRDRQAAQASLDAYRRVVQDSLEAYQKEVQKLESITGVAQEPKSVQTQSGNAWAITELFELWKRFADDQLRLLEDLKIAIEGLSLKLSRYAEISAIPHPPKMNLNRDAIQRWQEYIDKVYEWNSKQNTEIKQLQSEVLQHQRLIEAHTVLASNLYDYVLDRPLAKAGGIDETEIIAAEHEILQRLREQSYRTRSVSVLCDAQEDMVKLSLLAMRIKQEYGELSEEEAVFLPLEMESLFELGFQELCDQLADDDRTCQALKLSSPGLIQTESAELLSRRLCELLQSDWYRYARILAADAYLTQFLSHVDDGGRYQKLIFAFAELTERVRHLLGLAGVKPLDITLFKTPHNPEFHNAANFRQYVNPVTQERAYLTRSKRYVAWLRTRMKAEPLPDNVLVEIHAWGFTSVYDCFPAQPATVVMLSDNLLPPE